MAESETENIKMAIESDSDFMHVDSAPITNDRDEELQTSTTNNFVVEELDEKKLAQRANRFGTDVSIPKAHPVAESDLNSLYKSLAIDSQDLAGSKNGRVRFNAIHLRGVENMNTQDVLDYFKEYSPDLVEWINDHSCNVVWSDSSLSARAIFDLSRPVKKCLLSKTNSTKESSEEIAVTSEPEEGEDVEMTEQESEEQRKRHISAESDLQQSRFRRNSGTPVPNNSPVDTSQIDDGIAAEIESSKIDVPIPPGNWRLGIPVEKAKALLLRFAYRTDRKQPGAEKLSQYYVKYGNPNYKGLKGFISSSYKSKIHDGRKRPHYVDLDAPVEDGELPTEMYTTIPLEQDYVVPEQTKRPRMRMYADEEEERQKQSASASGPSLHPADLRNRIVHEKSQSSGQQASLDDLRGRLHSRQPWNTPHGDESFEQELADVQSLLTPRRLNLSEPVVMGDLRNKLEKLRQARQPKVPLLIEVSQDDA